MNNPLENALKSLMHGEHSSLSLTFNDEVAVNYMTVAEYVEQDMARHTDWVSDEEKALAIKNNSMWTLHWYPDTPVGFCSYSASTLEALFDKVFEREAA